MRATLRLALRRARPLERAARSAGGLGRVLAAAGVLEALA